MARVYACSDCEKTFKKKCYLARHSVTHSGVKPFKCEKCQSRFARKDGLKRHMKRKHDRNRIQYVCDCGRSLSSKWYLGVHIRRCTGTGEFNCNECKLTFPIERELRRHMTTHDDSTKIHLCQFCGYKCRTISNLNKHIKTHTGEKEFECTQCLERFSSKQSLDNHVRIHTGEKPFKCGMCHEWFARKQYLKNHMREHTGERFECDECEESFTSRQGLDYHHQLKHSDDPKPFKCDFEDCEYSCVNESNLKKHKRRHSEDRPYSCSFCTKSFKRNEDLKEHVRIHTGERPFQCTTCNATFVSGGNMRRHMRRGTCTARN